MGVSVRPMLGTYHAAAALRNLERQQEVAANNLANVSTTGFRGERVFSRLLEAGAAPVVDAATDRRAGALTMTGSPLDVALGGEGFFVIDTPDGERLTRGGSWRLGADGMLVDALGAHVLGEDADRRGTGGPVRIPRGAKEVSIAPDGALFVDGARHAMLRIEGVDPAARLEHAGDGRFVPGAERTRLDERERDVRQGALEESNVGSVDALVGLIEIQRAYASVQKVLTTIDGARGITASDIAKPL